MRNVTLRSTGRHAARRRGVAVILVLALLSITLALSYAMMRTEATIATMQRNYSHRGSARQAAFAGISLGLRKMHEPNWAGVDVDLQGNLGAGQSYLVTYETGDPQLTPSDPDYAEYPYRVTVTSTGTAADPGDPGVSSTYQIQAVVRLVPREMSAPPANWASLQPYTVYQWATGGGREFDIEVPARIEGPVRLHNEVNYLLDYPNDGDDKPFHGNIDEVAIFATALSDIEILALQTGTLDLLTLTGTPAKQPIAWWRFDEAAGATSAADELGNYPGDYDGGQAGGAPAASQGGSGSAIFDGFDDHINLGAIDVAGAQLTLLARFRADSFNHADGRLISKAMGSYADDHFWMLSTIDASGDYRLRFRLKTSSNGTSTLIADSGNLTTGDWVFAAAVYDGSEMRLYKDGVRVGTLSKTGLLSTDSTVLASIGNNPPASPRGRLLRDFEAMRVAGQGDFRPFTGPIYAPWSLTPAHERALLQKDSNLTLHNVSAGSGAEPVAHPGDVASYQLYPGGRVYLAQSLPGSLSNATLVPDLQNNPLGLFKYPTELRLWSNVSIQGTLLTYDPGNRGDVEIRGSNVTLSPVSLPPLYGDSTVYQLPAVIAGDDFRIFPGATCDITGLTMAWDDFELEQTNQANTVNLQGKLITAEVELRARNEWDRSSLWWRNRCRSFLLQLDDPSPILHFPVWLNSNHGLDYQPKLNLKPDPAGVSYHWHDWNGPLFQPHPSDGGLRWDLLEWRDNP